MNLVESFNKAYAEYESRKMEFGNDVLEDLLLACIARVVIDQEDLSKFPPIVMQSYRKLSINNLRLFERFREVDYTYRNICIEAALSGGNPVVLSFLLDLNEWNVETILADRNFGYAIASVPEKLTSYHVECYKMLFSRWRQLNSLRYGSLKYNILSSLKKRANAHNRINDEPLFAM